MTGRCFSRAEVVFVLGVSAVVLILACAPYAAGYLTTPPGLEYGGYFGQVDDYHSYLAKMRQGMEGSWLYHNPFTPEDHEPMAVFLFYIALGHLAGVLGWSLEFTWHVARGVCGALFLLMLYPFLALFLPQRIPRQVAYLLLCGGSGLGWLVLLAGHSTLCGIVPVDFWLNEAYPFFTVLTFPHFALTNVLIMAVMAAIYFLFRTRQLRYGLGAGLGQVILGVVNSFNVVSIALAAAGLWVITAARQRRLPWREGWGLALMELLSLPLYLYYLYTLTTNPVFRVWSQQNRLPSPAPALYAAGAGLIGLLAVGGLAYALRHPTLARDLIWTWAVTGVIALYLPVAFQRRLVAGLFVPLGILAAWGLFRYVLPVLRRAVNPLQRPGLRHRVQAAALLLLLMGASLSNVVVWTYMWASILAHQPPHYHTMWENQALDWLRTHTARTDTVLASIEVGSYAPARAGNRVFAGHWIETIHAQEKVAELLRFFDASASDAGRQAFLARYRIAFLFYGPFERALGDFNPAGKPYLQEVYRNAECIIYRVVLPDSYEHERLVTAAYPVPVGLPNPTARRLKLTAASRRGPGLGNPGRTAEQLQRSFVVATSVAVRRSGLKLKATARVATLVRSGDFSRRPWTAKAVTTNCYHSRWWAQITMLLNAEGTW